VISAAAALGVVVHRRRTRVLSARRHYATRPAGRVVALGSVAVLMTVVVSVLATLDQLFGVGARVHPEEMTQAIDLVLTDEKNPAIIGPCR
jgi:hypothetical protein